MSTFIEQERQYQEDPITEPRHQRKTTCRSIFCSKLAKGLFIVLLIALTLPTIAYFFVISRNITHDYTEGYCLIDQEYRVPCGLPSFTQSECEAVSCCFNKTTGQCHHYFPSRYFYKLTENGFYTPSREYSPYGNKSVENLQFSILKKGPNTLSLVIHDSSEIVTSGTSEEVNYEVIIEDTKKLILDVVDKDKDKIFSTANSALIATEYYWEWSFQLLGDTIFGLDRNAIRLSGNETLTKVIYKNKVDHTTQPVFWAYKNEKFYGCVIKHDGPLEIQVLPSNIIILRSLLGKKIEVELSFGSTPIELYQQQVEEIVVPPLWTLGAHNCRKGDTLKLSEILEIYRKNTGFAFDTDCFHENLFMALQLMNTSDKSLPDFQAALNEMVQSGTKFLFSLPPHIILNETNSLYISAKELDILYKYQSGIVYNGTYLGQTVVYPDYSDSNIETFIQSIIDWIKDIIPIENISGFVLNANWPQDDKYENVEKTYLSYYSDEINKQLQYTLPWTLLGTDGRMHLETHNLYGSSQYHALNSYLNKTTEYMHMFVISATKTYGDTEPEILENFETSWDNFRMYINKIVFSSITGNHMIGIPVCGDTNSYNKILHETLCLRWYLAAATMPYFQVSSDDPFRDPTNLNSGFATRAAELAIQRRRLLIDYYYTILEKKEPLVRPLYYNYYTNVSTFTMDRQYTIGSELLIAYPFSSGNVKLRVYLPPERGIWYEFWAGTMFQPDKKNGYVIEIDSLETDWTMFIAQGHILAMTDTDQLNLYIALNCSSQENSCTASGELYKDNVYLTFTATNSSVTINNLPDSCTYTVGYLKVYSYHGTTGYSNRYDKNVNVCESSLNTITINYE